jgi:proteasome accessory factor A
LASDCGSLPACSVVHAKPRRRLAWVAPRPEGANVKERPFGTETEYAIAPSGDQGWGNRDRVCRWLLTQAYSDLPCVRDLSSGGVFLVNASRLYIDTGHHVEIGTAEVWNPWDAVRYILAGEQILQKIAAGAGAPAGWERPLILKTNVDYECQTSWGTHESILTSRATGSDRLADNLVSHLVTRVLYGGAGGWNPFSIGLEFVLTPRAMFLEQRSSSSSTGARGIWHERDEALADGRFRRIHLLCGESLNSHTAMWLRAATTVVVTALADGGVDAGVGVALADPVAALVTIACDPSCRALA